jgi:citrate synthase
MSDTAQIRIGDITLDLPIEEGTEGGPAINITPLLKLTGATTLDYGFANTAVTRSAITWIDGDAGIVRYRGYPLEQLADSATFLETAYMLIHGDLPTPSQEEAWVREIKRQTHLHEDLKRFFEAFPRDAHPMAVLSSAVAALGTFYQDSYDPYDPVSIELSTVRLIAKLPTIAAYAFKRSIGEAFVYPTSRVDYIENFLNMMFSQPGEDYGPDPDVADVLRKLLILHADHEQNCSTSTVRMVGSAHANLYVSVAAGI